MEDLDAARYPSGFDTSGFTPAVAAGWTPAVTRPTIADLTPGPAAGLRLAAHQPAKITALGPGRYLLDFGATQVGGPAGDSAAGLAVVPVGSGWHRIAPAS